MWVEVWPLVIEGRSPVISLDEPSKCAYDGRLPHRRTVISTKALKLSSPGSCQQLVHHADLTPSGKLRK